MASRKELEEGDENVINVEDENRSPSSGIGTGSESEIESSASGESQLLLSPEEHHPPPNFKTNISLNPWEKGECTCQGDVVWELGNPCETCRLILEGKWANEFGFTEEDIQRDVASLNAAFEAFEVQEAEREKNEKSRKSFDSHFSTEVLSQRLRPHPRKSKRWSPDPEPVPVQASTTPTVSCKRKRDAEIPTPLPLATSTPISADKGHLGIWEVCNIDIETTPEITDRITLRFRRKSNKNVGCGQPLRQLKKNKAPASIENNRHQRKSKYNFFQLDRHTKNVRKASSRQKGCEPGLLSKHHEYNTIPYHNFYYCMDYARAPLMNLSCVTLE